MAQITRELALKIARKLKATIKTTGRAHDLACVYHDGKLITHFGIRRGSSKNLGHDHVVGSLFVGMRNTRLLGECSLLRDEWLALLVERGKID